MKTVLLTISSTQWTTIMICFLLLIVLCISLQHKFQKMWHNSPSVKLTELDFSIQMKNQLTLINYPIARIISFDNNNEGQEKIQHPNKRLFYFLQKIEKSFTKHCKYSNVFELVVNDVTGQELEYPCSDHAKDVYAYVISYYLQNRMRQFAKLKMADVKRTNAKKKKASKLTKT